MYNYRGWLIKVVDGDTVDLRVDVGFHWYFEGRFRLMGIDTPERGQKGYLEAKEMLQTLLEKRELVINTYPAQEKYGRYLCDITAVFEPGAENVNVVAVMLAGGLGKYYDGGSKS